MRRIGTDIVIFGNTSLSLPSGIIGLRVDGKKWNDEEGGGHAVLCDTMTATDPANHYWIALNSWVDTDDRQNGLFRVSMYDTYDDVDSGWLLQYLLADGRTRYLGALDKGVDDYLK